MKLEIYDIEKLAKKLESKSKPDFIKVCRKNTVLLKKAASKNTPVGKSTKEHVGGSLKQSIRVEYPTENSDGVVGYIIEYAPHVEFGHRTVNGGFVKGQHFLGAAVEEVRPIFYADLKEALKK